MQVRAIAKDIGIHPRKMRLVTNAVKGRTVSDALAILKFLPNAGAEPVISLHLSTVKRTASPRNNEAVLMAQPSPRVSTEELTTRRYQSGSFLTNLLVNLRSVSKAAS